MWILYALLTAFMFSTSDALTKRALVARDEYFVAWVRLLFSLPVLMVSFFFIDIPPLDTTFWAATITALPLEITAIILYTRALKLSPISLSMPFLSMTPLFLIVTSFLIVGEKITFWGGTGILLIVLGSYMLNIHKVHITFFEPIRAILKEPGSVLILIVAFIYSLTSSLGKMAIEHSSPVFFGCVYFILVTLFFTPIALMKNRGQISLKAKDIVPLSSIGITYSLMILFHMIAMSMTQVAYMISVKRMSLLFSVLYGYFIFKENRISERLIGSTIMLAGFLLILFGK